MTEAELNEWRAYYAEYLKNRRAGTLDGYTAEELEALNAYHEEWQARFKPTVELFKEVTDLLNSSSGEVDEMKPLRAMLENALDPEDYRRVLEEIKREAQQIRERTASSLQMLPYIAQMPQKTAIPSSKVARNLVQIDELSRQGVIANIQVGKGGSGEIIVPTSFNYDDARISIPGRQLSHIDKSIHSGACAIYAANIPYFTLPTLYKAANGITGNIDIDPETLAPYRESLENCMHKWIEIDATQQLAEQYKRKVKKAVYANWLLPLKKVTVTMNNGTILEGYAFLDCPPLLAYSGELKQVISADIKLLDTRKTIRSSIDLAPIKEYLLLRIEGMKNMKNSLNNTNIRYDTIFKEVGIDTDTLDKFALKRRRDSINAILESYKAAGLIKDAVPYREGRSFAGVKITL